MLTNYLKIAWRNLKKNKSYALINIGGLAIALAVVIVIGLFVRHELSYDRFFSDSGQIYRVLFVDQDGNARITIPEPIAGEIKEIYPEVEHSVRVSGPYGEALLKGENELYSAGWATVGAEFFTIFDFHFIAGDPATALSSPGSVVITESLAQKLFSRVQVVGETIEHENVRTLSVTGVITDPPTNTHFTMEAFAYREPFAMSQWNMYTNTTYVELNNADQAGPLTEKLLSYIEEYQNFSEGMVPNVNRIELQPITDIHMDPQGSGESSSRWFYIRVLLLVGGLILLVACINYINMATAQSAGRSMEIGIRKTVGAEKRQVISQVMLESILTCSIAFLLSFLLVEFFKPIALTYFDINLSSPYQWSVGWIGFLAGLLIFVSVLSGGYAAFYLSSFRPSGMLKGSGIQSGKGASLLRKTLVVTQFGISIAIVIASLLISRQMEFVRTERLNGADEQVVVIQNNSQTLAGQFSAFKTELLRHPGVGSVSAGTIPNNISFTTGFEDSTGGMTFFSHFSVEYDYLKTLGLNLISGRTFDPRLAQDSTGAVILNESAARYFGIDEATGQRLNRFRGQAVIGIVQDFHSHTLFESDQPVVIEIMNSNMMRMSRVLVRLNTGQISAGLDHIEKVWDEFVPEYPLNFQFLDTIMDQDYRAELRLARIFNIFSGFSLLIACLGLFGLAAYTAERRTKEIGIRKTMGATATNIVGLLSKDFMQLVLFGYLLAAPLAWFAMQQWLQKFAYRIDMNAGIFLLGGGIAISIALATVSWQALRAASTNPVEALRYE